MGDPIPTNEDTSYQNFTLQHVKFSSIFEFSALFRAFRLAIQPACMITALLAILVIYGAGRIFDVVWSYQVLPGEIAAFHSPIPGYYNRLLKQNRFRRTQAIMDLLQRDEPNLSLPQVDALADNPAAAYDSMRAVYERRFIQAVHAAAQPGVSRALINHMRQQATRQLLNEMRQLQSMVGRGVFSAVMRYEIKEFHLLVNNTAALLRLMPMPSANGESDQAMVQVGTGILPLGRQGLWKNNSITGCLANMFITGPTWLLTGAAPVRAVNPSHGVGLFFRRFLYVLSVLLLVLVSIIAIAWAGAMICRQTALEFVGRRPMFSANIAFTAAHLGSFIKAPLLPFITILGTGLALTVLSLIGAIPFLGEMFVGLIFIVFLILGFIIMLMVLGLIGGFNLIYPTLAVEGSDSFDAISRSFSYVYARPWQMLFYTLLLLVYGVATYLFLSFAMFVLLAGVHIFVGWGMTLFGLVHGWYTGSGKLAALWPAPRFGQLIAPINWWAMNWSETIGALFLYCWLFLTVALLGAYVISFYFAGNTILYLLLRRSVDGQALNEIFPDQSAAPTAVAAQPSAAAE
ncbi:MAG: hypothetical protein ACP5VQ_08245 [Phycisphaerae bacterium]